MLWEACNKLRGSMDASQYKDYVLIILFVKYLSDKKKQNDTVFEIPEGSSFDDLIKIKTDEHIGEKINKALEALREANSWIIGKLALPNFNDENKLGKGKDMVKALGGLIGVFQNDNIDFSKNRAAGDDILGDAYEYLMKNFAAESGKSKGQFYTPAEVSRTMAQLLCMNEFASKSTTIYDPTCGSGSLLLRAMNETQRGQASLRGQEKDNTTASLAILNMLLHGVDDAEIQGNYDTLTQPQFVQAGTLETFDICVANPPFSQPMTGAADDMYHRWKVEAVPPAKNADYAFLLHLIASMKSDTGRGACILPHGVLFRGNVEGDIRKQVIDSGVIEGIVGLPSNVFYGTGIPACIILLNNKNRRDRKGIFFIDAKDGYVKDGNKNRLREQDIRRITDAWLNRDNTPEIPHFARFVSIDEIKQNGYNLNIPRYVTSRDTEIQQDIECHLKGGLPMHDIDEQLADIWYNIPSLKDELFCRTGDVYTLRCKPEEIGATVAANADFQKQKSDFISNVDEWLKSVRPTLDDFGKQSKVKETIAILGNSVFDFFTPWAKDIADAYNIYDICMNYCNDTMQDDLYMISADGWVADPHPTAKKPAKPEDYECDLLPVGIVIDEFFAKEKTEIDALQSHLEEQQAKAEEMEERSELNEEYFGGSRKEASVKAAISKHAKEGKNAPNKIADSIVEVWKEYYQLLLDIKKTKGTLKEKNQTLTTAMTAKYDELKLQPDETKVLVIEKKWFATLRAQTMSELNRVEQSIVGSVDALQTRYARTLSQINKSVTDLEAKVMSHLNEMGFTL